MQRADVLKENDKGNIRGRLENVVHDHFLLQLLTHQWRLCSSACGAVVGIFWCSIITLQLYDLNEPMHMLSSLALLAQPGFQEPDSHKLKAYEE